MKASAKTGKVLVSRRGGRPSRQQAEQIEGQILDVARDMFFTQGYGATSIEMIARQAHISKRTFYDRFHDKADLFQAVVRRLIENLRPPNTDGLFEGRVLEDILLRLAEIVLQAALTPQALALHRLTLTEAIRFPELAKAVSEQGGRQEAVNRIAELLNREIPAKHLNVDDASFAAEQFLQMVVSLPQRRALGLGKPMTPRELKDWAQATVNLFLNGLRRNQVGSLAP